MGILDLPSSALGFGDTGGQKALDKFGRQSAGVAGALRRFRPFRTTSALGTQRVFEKDGEAQFDIDSPFLTEALSQFGDAQTGGSDAILELLRSRAAPEFDRQFGRLESRALQQGRLGLNVGGRGTPEFSSFFGAKQDADLNFQLQAFEESRRNRGFLLGEAGGIQGLLSSQLKDLQGFGQLQAGRDVAASNLESGGLIAMLQGLLSESDQDRSLFGGAISSIGVGPVSASF